MTYADDFAQAAEDIDETDPLFISLVQQCYAQATGVVENEREAFALKVARIKYGLAQSLDVLDKIIIVETEKLEHPKSYWRRAWEAFTHTAK